MKWVKSSLLVTSLFLVSCGSSAEEKAQEEIRAKDSILAKEAAMKAVEEANKAIVEMDTTLYKVDSTISAVSDSLKK